LRRGGAGTTAGAARRVAGERGEELEKAERGRRVRKAIENLPDFLRGVLVLAYLKDLSMQDIAAIENCSVGTVKSRIFRGKQLLRATLAESEE
jgi:RNA polymerase sigma-70 factor, ECF subfamily